MEFIVFNDFYPLIRLCFSYLYYIKKMVCVFAIFPNAAFFHSYQHKKPKKKQKKIIELSKTSKQKIQKKNNRKNVFVMCVSEGIND